MSPTEVIARYERDYGQRLTTFINQRRAEKYYVVQLKDPVRKIIVNPYTGSEIHRPHQGGTSFWSWVIDIHMNLGLGTVGKYISGTASFLLAVVLISTGIYLWWPKSKRALKRAFTINWSASWKRKNYDLHNVGGWYTHLAIGLLAFTGACFTFPNLGPNLLNFLSGQSRAPVDADTRAMAGQELPQLSFAEVARLAEQLYPDYHLMHIVYNQGSNSPIVVTNTNQKWISPGKYIRTYSYLNPHTGEVLHQYDPRTASFGEKITDYYKRQIHYGEIGGWTTRVLAFLAGLCIPALYITGVMIWYNRKWGKKKRKRSGGRQIHQPTAMPWWKMS